MTVKTSKVEILDRLRRTVCDNDAMLKERISALKVLLKHDRENTISMVEDMYRESDGIAHIQISDMLLRIIRADSEKEKFIEIDFDE